MPAPFRTLLLAAFLTAAAPVLAEREFMELPGTLHSMEAYETFDASIRPRAHPNLAEPVRQLRRANLEAALQALSKARSGEVFLFGRDMEYVTFTARYIALNVLKDPKLAAKLHHIAENGSGPGYQEYLTQNGMTKGKLEAGAVFHLIDTGYVGTAVDAIAKRFPGHEKQFRGSLIQSTNPLFPGSYSFFTALDPKASQRLLGTMEFDIDEIYERYLPHYLGESPREVVKVGERYHVVASRSASEATEPREIREDLAHYLDTEGTQRLVAKRWNTITKLEDLARSGTRSALLRRLTELSASKDPFDVATARDFVEAHNRHCKMSERVALADIGFPRTITAGQLAAIPHFAHLAAAVHDPAYEVRKLLATGNLDKAREVALELGKAAVWNELAGLYRKTQEGWHVYYLDQSLQNVLRTSSPEGIAVMRVFLAAYGREMKISLEEVHPGLKEVPLEGALEQLGMKDVAEFKRAFETLEKAPVDAAAALWSHWLSVSLPEDDPRTAPLRAELEMGIQPAERAMHRLDTAAGVGHCKNVWEEYPKP